MGKNTENSKNDNLLEIIILARTVKALDKAVCQNSDYKNTIKKQTRVFKKLEQAGLSEEQQILVERAISAANECGAVYGVIAYRLGFHDGIKLIAEICEIG